MKTKLQKANFAAKKMLVVLAMRKEMADEEEDDVDDDEKKNKLNEMGKRYIKFNEKYTCSTFKRARIAYGATINTNAFSFVINSVLGQHNTTRI